MGEYEDPQKGYHYFHACPLGTLFPRDENITYELDETRKAVNRRARKGRLRKEGGATIVRVVPDERPDENNI